MPSSQPICRHHRRDATEVHLTPFGSLVRCPDCVREHQATTCIPQNIRKRNKVTEAMQEVGIHVGKILGWGLMPDSKDGYWFLVSVPPRYFHRKPEDR